MSVIITTTAYTFCYFIYIIFSKKLHVYTKKKQKKKQNITNKQQTHVDLHEIKLMITIGKLVNSSDAFDPLQYYTT